MPRWLLPLAAVLLLSEMSRAEKPNLDTLLDKKTFTRGKSVLLYRLLSPATVEKDKTYPLVVFLHGSGERGDDNKGQLKHGIASFASDEHRKKFPCYLIVPQCPAGSSWSGGGRKSAKDETAKERADPGAEVLALIEQACKDLPIDKSRIYLTGLSMGGYGTWQLLARKPELFAAGIPICGGGDEKQADKLAKVPIWAFHGDKDAAVKVERTREMIAAIKKAGGMPKYTEYPGVGHDSWTQTYADEKVLDWLFAQKKE